MNVDLITLRPFTRNDRERILDILTSDSVNRTYMLPDYETRADAIPLFDRLTDLSHDPSRFVRCIAADGAAVGFLNDVEIESGTIELGYAIHPEFQNRGIMTAALREAIECLWKLGYRCVVCGAFEENKASIRVMEKCGMKLTDRTDIISYRGRDRRCVYYQIRKEETSC